MKNLKDFDLVRQIRRHQFQFHQILQKDLKETRIKFIYFLYKVAKASSAEVRSQLFSIGFKLYYKIEFGII
jgi:hypothetical protein